MKRMQNSKSQKANVELNVGQRSATDIPVRQTCGHSCIPLKLDGQSCRHQLIESYKSNIKINNGPCGRNMNARLDTHFAATSHVFAGVEETESPPHACSPSGSPTAEQQAIIHLLSNTAYTTCKKKASIDPPRYRSSNERSDRR